MAEIHGTWDPKFDSLAELVSDSLDKGTDVGASVAVTIEGELVVDLWGGWVDDQLSVPWVEDTIVNVWSTTKTMTSLCAFICADRGLIDFDAPVAKYWPEFAANGKEAVLVKHLLSHTSGLAGWDAPFEVADIYDWEKSTSHLARQAPWWEPGSKSGYHGMTQGHLVGEVIRRVTGKMLGEFFAEEVAGPLDLDFHIGLDPAHDSRVAPIIPFPPKDTDYDAMDKDSVVYKAAVGPKKGPEIANTIEWRRADIGAANGHGNARSVAKAQAIIANGGTLDGIEFLRPQTIERIFEEQADGIDLVFREQQRFGIGYGLPARSTSGRPESRVCFWGGWGGSKIVLDLDTNMTFSYVMNRMDDGLLGDERGENLRQATFAAVRVTTPQMNGSN